MTSNKNPVEQPSPVASIQDPQLLAILKAFGAGAHGLTPRCCECIRDFVMAHFPESARNEQLVIAGELGEIIRQES